MLQMLTEAKNLHMEHLEDNILNGGVDGTRQTINFLRALRDMLAGSSREKVNVSVKWDGAPSIFAGTDPRDGKFFVAKKGIFNKEPKIYKTAEEIDLDLSGTLASKFKTALRYFPELGIDGILQGDFLFTKEDLKQAKIGDERMLTFHPNTIVYAVPLDSDIAKDIRRSKIGVVWHTMYEGDDFDNLRAIFNQPIVDSLRSSRNVWYTDAQYRDVSGSVSMTQAETEMVTNQLRRLGRMFNNINRKQFEFVSENEDYLIRLKTFINSKVRDQQPIRDPGTFVSEFLDHVDEYFSKQADQRKTERGKQSVMLKRDKMIDSVDPTSLVMIIELYNGVIAVKKTLIEKLNRANGLGTFLLTDKGYQVTNQEGFVAADRMGTTAVKLVDRLEFSYSNFSKDVIKGFER